MEQISYNDFAKIELRTAKVISAEKLEGSTKLLVLKVEIGNEERTILAGIAEKYDTEELVGKTVIVVANLAPKEIKGMQSQGMLLAVDGEDGPVLLVPEEDVPSGV